jgi:putative tryptophan/tyrosine transport system substrate-binding protein
MARLSVGVPPPGLAVVLALNVILATFVDGQEGGRRPRIGWLTSSVVHTHNVDAFRDGMRALGYPDITLEVQAASGQMDQLPALAARLVARNVEVIVTDGGPAAVAAKRATSTVPIVIGATAADLVRLGLVASLARPGGNVTGFTISTGPELYGKRLELLREALPGLNRVAIMWNPSNEDARASLETIDTSAKRLGLHITVVEGRNAQQIDQAFAGAARSRAGAILTVADAFLWSQRARIVSASAVHRLPGMYPEVEFAEAGGLLAYGPNVPDNFRRAAAYVDQILKGRQPAELPVQLPTKFELVVNRKTARTLGLTIPQSVLLQADKVIE